MRHRQQPGMYAALLPYQVLKQLCGVQNKNYRTEQQGALKSDVSWLRRFVRRTDSPQV